MEPLYYRPDSYALIWHRLSLKSTGRGAIARRAWSIGFFCVITTPLTAAAEIPTPAHHAFLILFFAAPNIRERSGCVRYTELRSLSFTTLS
jgi:hypothetical protein